ncbi:MAG TPA: hypothetical protein VM553_00525 [Dongiaceae bacterium]|nr:hypothetical protein [Dongiaceae bacterium]
MIVRSLPSVYRSFSVPVLAIFWLLAVLALQGCSKSSDADMDGDGVPEAYGLTTRPTLGTLNIPITPPGTGDPALVAAFPDLPAFDAPV